MIFRIIISIIGILPLLSVAEETDLLRFDNDDQIHGQFQGFDEKNTILWKRNEAEGEPIQFNTSDIRQIILNSGKPDKSIVNLSYIGNVNGDRVAGSVQEIDEKRVLIQTDFAGLLEFPRDQVAIVAPNPMGGRVLYHGPFDKSEWIQRTKKSQSGIPMDKDEAEIEKEFPLWKFSGSAWYWKNGSNTTALTRESGMTDRTVIQFDLAWKNRLSVAVAFHADFKVPENVKDNSEENAGRQSNVADFPLIFGSSYVLHLYSNYVVLYRSGFDDEMKPFTERLQSKNSSLQLSNAGTSKIEIRCNRKSGDIILFVDGKFICDWKEKIDTTNNKEVKSDHYIGKGEGYGFITLIDESPIRLSVIIVADWNGIPDSARSLESDESDIVLLNNGTDRFSGKVSAMKDGKLSLTGRYGNFSFPMTEIAEIRFAKSQLKEVDDSAPAEFKVRFHPHGTISGQVVSGTKNSIRLLNSSAGEINIDLSSASLLEFKSNHSYLDDWNVEF